MSNTSRQVLDPVERVSEILFGLIMVLTVTGSLSAATAGRTEVREMLVGALGCNFAWGIVDAAMYLLGSLLGRGRRVALLQALRASADPERARAMIASVMDPDVASLLRPGVFETVRQDLAAAPAAPERASLSVGDLRGAAEVLLLVFLSTFPVVIPFVMFREIAHAMRVSNAIALIMLCAGGYSLGRYSGLGPWRTAGAMTALGMALVGVTIALGG